MATLFDLIPRAGDIMPRRDILESLFEDIPAPFFKEKKWVPPFDVVESEKQYTVTAEMPGIDVKDLDVTFSDGLLTIKGEKKQQKEEEGKDYHRIERYYGSFRRSFRIPEKIQDDNIDASYKDGVLKLVLTKATPGEPKKIEVKQLET